MHAYNPPSLSLLTASELSALDTDAPIDRTPLPYWNTHPEWSPAYRRGVMDAASGVQPVNPYPSGTAEEQDYANGYIAEIDHIEGATE